MNNTGKPINIKKYPLIEQCYNLVREIDSLPASTEATFLVVKAGELMDEVWNYLESHQPKDRLSSLMVEALKAKYLGKKVKDGYAGIVFTVEEVEVTPDGPDPQMAVILRSKRCREATEKWKAWQLENNPMGTLPTSQVPAEVQQPYEDASRESVWMSQVDDVLPEIVENKGTDGDFVALPLVDKAFKGQL